MSFPVLGHQDTARIGMTFELDAEHIIDFALAPIRDLEYTRCGRDLELGGVDRNPQLQG